MADILPLPVADDLDVLVDRLDEQGHLDIQNNILRNFFHLGRGLGALFRKVGDAEETKVGGLEVCKDTVIRWKMEVV